MLFFITVVVLLSSVQANLYSDCGSKLATLEKVQLSGCAETAKECVFKRNSNFTLSLDFTPSKDVKVIEAELHGVIMNMVAPFPLPQPDGCKNNGLTCPLKAGQKASYVMTLPILKSYPKVRAVAKWELKNEDHENLICILIPLKIK
ncbi:unnamed protein product [Parnassius apollo]|uniref:(apollo) hypothetical protein n=1 Tax=Parnassius apollo TaxID=110799 RepID=A0A8S3XZL8_PARAO|nr:unnamed protein product [Parnassius apollo]